MVHPDRGREADRHGATFATAAPIAAVVATLVTIVTVGGLFARGEIGVVGAVEVVAAFLIPYVVSGLGLLARTRAPLGEGH